GGRKIRPGVEAHRRPIRSLPSIHAGRSLPGFPPVPWRRRGDPSRRSRNGAETVSPISFITTTVAPATMIGRLPILFRSSKDTSVHLRRIVRRGTMAVLYQNVGEETNASRSEAGPGDGPDRRPSLRNRGGYIPETEATGEGDVPGGTGL